MVTENKNSCHQSILYRIPICFSSRWCCLVLFCFTKAAIFVSFTQAVTWAAKRVLGAYRWIVSHCSCSYIATYLL